MVLVSLLEESRPVCERADKHAGVDEVEFVGEDPVLFEIVNLETKIRRDPRV